MRPICGKYKRRTKLFALVLSLATVSTILLIVDRQKQQTVTKKSGNPEEILSRKDNYRQYAECRKAFNEELTLPENKGFLKKQTPMPFGIFPTYPNSTTYWVILGVGEMLRRAEPGEETFRVVPSVRLWMDNAEYYLNATMTGKLGYTLSHVCEDLSSVNMWTIILKCTIDKLESVGGRPIKRASVIAKHKSRQVVIHTSPQLLICNHENAIVDRKLQLAACTQVGRDHFRRIPEWLEYHTMIGFQNFILYVNEDESAYKELESKIMPVYGNIVTLIPSYVKGVNGFLLQTSLQTECLTRMKGLVRWLAFHDVDEYFQLYSSVNKTLLEFLESTMTKNGNIGGVSFRNWYFGTPNNEQATESFISEWQWRTKALTKTLPDKVILLPENVVSYHVHWITNGGDSVTVNPITQGRLCHYRSPASQEFLASKRRGSLKQDVSMSTLYGPVIVTNLRSKGMLLR